MTHFRSRRRLTCALHFGLCLALVSPVQAQLATWRVVSGTESTVVLPGLPAGTRLMYDEAVTNTGQPRFGMRLGSPTPAVGYWANTAGIWQQYAAENVADVRGPGRAGAEAKHQFLSLANSWGMAAADGQRLFAARASDPAQTLFASYGLWRFDGARNVEFARASTDGVLGPGLGINWTFPNNSNFPEGRMLAGGQAIFQNDVTSPGGATTRMIAKHVPGLGNVPCMRVNATEAALAPGVTTGDSFLNFSSFATRLMVSPSGRAIARFTTSASIEALFELCNGAPRALAVTQETGNRGPQVGQPNAVFTAFSTVPTLHGVDRDFFYIATWRVAPNPNRESLFRHINGQNIGIAYNESSGFNGPNLQGVGLQGSTWNDFSDSDLTTTSDYSAFVASVNTPESTTLSGVWRVRAGQRPEPLALLNLTSGSYIPEAGRSWRSFDSLAVFANGDVLLNASTNPNNVRDLWLLRSGQPPQRVLSNGTQVTVPTSQGNVQSTVSTISIPDGGATHGYGQNSWVTPDGVLLVRVSSSPSGTLLITNKAAVPDPNVLLQAGFE